MKLSPKALDLLSKLFNETSPLQLPVACAVEVLEIREAVNKEISNPS